MDSNEILPRVEITERLQSCECGTQRCLTLLVAVMKF